MLFLNPPDGGARVRELGESLAAMEQLRKALARSLSEQWAMEQERTQALAALAHDLKTPLSIVSGSAELLEEGEITEDVVSLVVLMEKGNCLKPYFSAFEQKQMKQRLRALGESPTGKMVQEMVEYVENMMAIAVGLIAVYS